MQFDFFTGCGRADSHKYSRTNYLTGTFENIVAMAKAEEHAEPCHSPKDHHWAIFIDDNGPDARSTKTFKSSERVICNTVLWMDFDSGNPTFERIIQFAQAVSQGHEFLVYTSRSHGEVRDKDDVCKDSGHVDKAGTVKRKYRVAWPHTGGMPWYVYNAFGKALSKVARDWGLIPDTVAERVTQLCYLPNRGPEYQWHHQPGPRIDLQSPTFKWLSDAAQEIYAEQQSEKLGDYRQEGSLSYVAAFRRKHSVTEMLELYGFTEFGSSWNHPDASNYGKGGPLDVDDDDMGWVVALDTTVYHMLGRANGDSYDIYVAMQCGGNREQADIYAKQCLAEEMAPFIEHGTKLLAGLRFLDGREARIPTYEEAQKIIADEEKALKLAHDLAVAEEEKKEALIKKEQWEGKWVNELPNNVKLEKVTAMEWAAWHAPGIIGEIVRGKAPNLKRQSLVPALAGAISGMCFISQGKYVSNWNEHPTPSAILMNLVGGSSTGKSDAVSTFKDMAKMTDGQSTPLVFSHLSSGQALKDAMFKEGQLYNTNITIVQNEAGGKRAAGAGDKHQLSLHNEITDLHTAFEDGVEAGHTVVRGTSSRIPNPTINAILTSTPGKLFDSIDESDVEAGWLGRQAFIWLEKTKSNMNRRPRAYDASTEAKVAAIGNRPRIPQGEKTDVPVWVGEEGAQFFLVEYPTQLNQLMFKSAMEYDDRSINPHASEKESLICGRANEMLNRLVMIAVMASGDNVDQEHCHRWAKVIVDASIEVATRRMDTVEDVSNLSAGAQIRAKVVEMFAKAKQDKKFFNTFGGKAKVEGSGIVITKNAIRRKLLDSKFASALIKVELEHMIEAEILVKQDNVLQLGGIRSEWYRLEN